MKAVGIIAEYNPFHNGHAYQIQKAKELSGADYAVVAMSGNFVQRGAPAIINKFDRAAAALQNGADLVFEIPTLWATASAEYFAGAGIALFEATGCVDAVSFGCESDNLPLMSQIANLLAREPEEYSRILAEGMKQGMTMPAAREKAVLSYLKAQNLHLANESASGLLSSPNNILALEYLKALRCRQSNIRPLPVLRKGSSYHDTEFSREFCSAGALRRHLLQSPPDTSNISDYVPPESVSDLSSPNTCFLAEEDFSEMLYYKLLCERENGFADYADSSAELSSRIKSSLRGYSGYHDFCKCLKSKDMTYTRISRALLHILLNIKKTDYENGKRLGYIPYLRLLGFRKEAACLLGEIKQRASCPMIARPKKDSAPLNPMAYAIFERDVFASDLYYGVLAQKNKTSQKNEFQRGLVRVRYLSDGTAEVP